MPSADLDRLTPDDPVRAVFRRALRDMLVLVGVLAVVGVGVGAWLRGTPGVWGALIGVAVALLFSGTTVVSMLRTANASVTTTGGVVLGAWLAKMVVLVALFAVLDGQDFYDRGVLVAVVLVGVLGSVLLDYRAVVGGRVPYVSVPGPADGPGAAPGAAAGDGPGDAGAPGPDGGRYTGPSS